jgi:hypothetical protein
MSFDTAVHLLEAFLVLSIGFTVWSVVKASKRRRP